MKSDENEARDPEDAEEDPKPPGIPEAHSATREKTPVPEDAQQKNAQQRPLGLPFTASQRLRLQLVLEEEDGKKTPSVPPPAREQKPSGQIPFESAELKDLRSLGRWIALSGLMTLTVGALTGLSYATGEGSVAHVVVGILSTAFGLWLLAAAVTFYRVARARKGREARHHLVTGFSLLRGALLLKSILLFSAMALGCFVFSLAASVLFLL